MQVPTIEHFRFEEDFMDNGMRCIPMIVRFKLDACGIKLKLNEWSKMNLQQRAQLAEYPIEHADELKSYKQHVRQLIETLTGSSVTEFTIDPHPLWAMTDHIPEVIIQKMSEHNAFITLQQWQRLGTLQRFSLVKLTRPGHENKNFFKAVKEFGLMDEPQLPSLAKSA